MLRGTFSECTCLGPILGDSDPLGVVSWESLVEKLRSRAPFPQIKLPPIFIGYPPSKVIFPPFPGPIVPNGSTMPPASALRMVWAQREESPDSG